MLRLDVAYRQQRTPMSCWWASLAVLIEYHTDRVLSYPWELDHRFRPPPGQADSLQWSASPGGALFLAHDEPWQSYRRGIDPDTQHVNRLADLGRLEPLERTTGRSTFGGQNFWGTRLDGAWMEQRLRAFGPIYIIRRRPGGHHAFLISGVLHRRGGRAGHGVVEVQDPWPGGQGQRVDVAAIQSELAPQLAAFNLLVFRDRRADPRILEERDADD